MYSHWEGRNAGKTGRTGTLEQVWVVLSSAEPNAESSILAKESMLNYHQPIFYLYY